MSNAYLNTFNWMEVIVLYQVHRASTLNRLTRCQIIVLG